MKKEKISIIGQCYNEEENIDKFYKEISKIMNTMSQVDFEVLFINDCSKDKSLEKIKSIAKVDDRIKCVSMSRNFGKDQCAMAGFKYATGDYITTMDLDLQDPPELLIEMYNSLKNEDYDIAAAKTVTRKGYKFLHKLFIKIYYGIFNKISNVKMIEGQRDYRLMKRKVVNTILLYNEKCLYNKGLLNDVGYKIKWIDYEIAERTSGTTKFKFKRLVKYAITGIISYSILPLKLILYCGFFFLLLSFLMLILLLVNVLVSLGINAGIFSIIIFIFVLFGIQNIFLGIIALYLSQIHIEVKNRPLYVVSEFINIDD